MSRAVGKALALLLRHDPGRFGVSLDAAGWAELDAVAGALQVNGAPLGRERLLRVVAEDEKGRFVLSPDGRRIRAAQGHSLGVDLGLQPTEPPELLWHGTLAQLVPRILAEGLRPMGRQHVHLSADEATARKVALRRRGEIAILRVLSGEMARTGIPLYRAENGVWLADGVPPAFLRGG